jgi:hypothetical protein
VNTTPEPVRGIHLPELPHALADVVEGLQERDPELLQRMLRYAAVRMAVYEGLREDHRGPSTEFARTR